MKVKCDSCNNLVERTKSKLIRKPFEYKDWTLYSREVKLKGGKIQNIYFFSKGKPKSGRPCELPSGYRVLEAKTKGHVLSNGRLVRVLVWHGKTDMNKREKN